MIPIPKLIEDDPNCKPSKPSSESAISRDSHQIMSKLKKVLGDLDPIEPKTNNEEIKKMQKRTAFVLGYQANTNEQDLLQPLQQYISLSLDDTYVTFGAQKDAGKLASAKTTALVLNEETLKNVEEVAPGDSKFEIKSKLGKKATKKANKLEREKTKGQDWYGMPATEVTDEIKRDLEVLKMRDALDPKRFYKKNSSKELPKYFQVGKYVDTPAEYYTDKVNSSGKSKNKTLVDELMADAEFKRYNKRKYEEIVTEKSKFVKKKDRKKFIKKQKLN